jgi:Zn-dependent protease with chaperone function
VAADPESESVYLRDRSSLNELPALQGQGTAAVSDATLDDTPRTEYFSGQMPQVKVSKSYTLGLGVVAFAMVLLPLVYFGFIVLVGWATYWWAVHALDWFFPVINGERHFFGLLSLIYLSPLLVGLLLVLFMLNSLFSKWRVVSLAVPISHVDHPEIFRFLGQLCQQMGAPIPSRIDVTLDINASAGLREGLRSFFRNDIALSFGLPLVAGLSCREFATVMAHELGHFNQRTAMRCWFLISNINGWLARAVYPDDGYDWVYDDAEGGSNLLIFLIGLPIMGLIRSILWVLLILGHALRSFMSRQMEFHADACAVAVGGTSGVLSLTRRLLVLHACADQTALQLRNRITPKYPDDLSSYIAMLSGQCAGETQGKLLAQNTKARTRWFESHPSDAERMARATAAAQPGIIHDERSATVLFNNFPELSKALTMMAYQISRRGQPIPSEQLFQVATPEHEAPPDTSRQQQLIAQYFSGLGSFLRPVLLGPESRFSFGAIETKLEQLKEAIQTLQSPLLPGFLQALYDLDAKMLQALGAYAATQVGISFRAEVYPLVPNDGTPVPAVLASLETGKRELAPQLQPFEEAARARLVLALSLLRTPALVSKIANTEQIQDEIVTLLHVFGKLSAAFPALLDLRAELVTLQTLGDPTSGPRSELHDPVLAESTKRSQELLATAQSALGSTGYPFEHPKGHISIVDYARTKQFDPNPTRMIQLEIQNHIQTLFALYHRVLGRLVEIALQIEDILKPKLTA